MSAARSKMIFLVLVAYVGVIGIHLLVSDNWLFTFSHLRSIFRNSDCTGLPVKNHFQNPLDVCPNLIAGDELVVQRAVNESKRHPRTVKLLESFPYYTEDCGSYINETGYITHSVTEEEKQFPIAFTLVVFKHASQVEQLLRAIYRPHNAYCVHVDKKSPQAFLRAVRAIVKCLPNVFVAPVLVPVQWGKYSVLEAELICMDSLLKQNVRWKYLINLTGQEYPLKTNYELVKILQAYRGANDIDGGYKRANFERWGNLKSVPHEVVPRKGSVHITASRAYVEYIRRNRTALDIEEWVKKTIMPDETFFPTLNYNPHLRVPGSYKGEADDNKRIWLTRYKLWIGAKTICLSGMSSHGLCIFGIADLHNLTTVPHLFANKFHSQFQPLTLDCLEWWYFRKVAEERLGRSAFNTTIYERRHFIRNSFI